VTYPGTVPNVCVIGKMGAGKTTVSQLLIERFPNLWYERLSVAGPLKTGCGTSTDRDLLQRVGVGVRELHEDFWVNLLLVDLDRRTQPIGGPRFVVDDCRFPNELVALKRAGFITIRVVAPVHVRIARLKGNGKLTDPEQLNHVSETALDTYEPDYRIVNDGAWQDDLVAELTAILNRERA
jgi:hypothetical protein